MASLCKKQQCTSGRRGFQQELHSWRHKLLHCVGFENILKGLIGPTLVEDLKFFKELEPVAVSDWSFDENCLFCCLKRDKVKERLIGSSKGGIEDTHRRLLVKDQITIIRFEKQTEEFLSAVLCRKDVPSFSDPHIPVVAREVLQRMISQFAVEYTSKTSSPQGSHSDYKPLSDQSPSALSVLTGPPPPSSPSATVAGPAHNQNPVLSKLLMGDQDAPLDLTMKKLLAEPSEQDGVLDLSMKKKPISAVRSPCLSPATPTLKRESPDIRVGKANDRDSTSTLKQFMAKLCPHHQRQIVDAIGFLQMEVKAHSSSSMQDTSNSVSDVQGTVCSTPNSGAVTPEKSHPDLRFPSESTPKAEVQDLSQSIPSSCVMKKSPENGVSPKTSVTAGLTLDICSPGSASSQLLASPTTNPVDGENSRLGEHAPLRMKIMTSPAVAGRKLCVLNTTLSSPSDTSEDRECNSNSSSRTETHSARLSSSVKRHSQAHQAKQREALGHAKETPAKLFPVHNTIPSDLTRTARKTVRTSSEHRTRDSVCKAVVDPDIGHCDIVFIDKPITECFKEQRSSVLPRRNARKSTRGHLYSNEIWELKTVRTLAGRGNCPHQMPALTTLVTPKQILSKPEGLPPVDMPFVGACRETMNQQMPIEESNESVIPGAGDAVEVAASKVDNVVVEPSQTDQGQSNQPDSPCPLRCPIENKDTVANTDVEGDATADSEMMAVSDESVNEPTLEAVKESDPEPGEVSHGNSEQTVAESDIEPVENITIEEAEPQLSSDKIPNSEPSDQQPSTPSTVSQVEEDKGEEVQDEQPQDLQSERQLHHDNSEMTEKPTTAGSAEEQVVKERDVKTPENIDAVVPIETKDKEGGNDLSKMSFDALLKELPPWRRKKCNKTSKLNQVVSKDTPIVGYVNGRPVSASDRHLRQRPGSNPTSPSKSPVKSSPSNSLVNATPDSAAENKTLELSPPETHMPGKSLETSPVGQQVGGSSSDTPSSPVSKLTSRTKQNLLQKSFSRGNVSSDSASDQAADQVQNTESKRQLRSASQKPVGPPASPPTSKMVNTRVSPNLSSLILPPPEQLSPLLLPYPLPVVASPLVGPSESPDSEKPQQNPAPDTLVLNVEDKQPDEEISEDAHKNEPERGSDTKPKLRSAKMVADSCKNEKEQHSSEESRLVGDQSPVKTEEQTHCMPLRSKRVFGKEANANDVALIQKKSLLSSEGRSASGDASSSPNRPTRMPLRSETSKAETSSESVTPSPSTDRRKVALRSQRLAALATGAPAEAATQSNVASPVKTMPERIAKAQVRSPSASVTSVSNSANLTLITPKHEPPKQMPNKFLEMLTGNESQQLVTNLNIKYDKMQKGWVQMDKEGQSGTKYRNKSDRQAAIWKSKRRTRKPKSSDQQKYSPVQMLFMKGFNLASICRWFLESTETKSLVIVKKVNTRLPSETQLCFHSSSSGSGTSQGVFPSLQAERLKKHLKKFAIASPVKSNPKSQKLIAKALEQEVCAVKGKERAEPPSNSQTKSYSSAKARVQISESQKPSGKSKNPASARILRKYSNIREKMQVQQTTAGLKGASKMLKSKKMKTLANKKSAAKSNSRPLLKGRKSGVPVGKQIKVSAAKVERRKILVGKHSTKPPVQVRAVKAQVRGRAARDPSKKQLPKRCSQRLGSPKTSEHIPADTSKSKAGSKKQPEADKAEVEKCTPNKVNPAKIQSKETSQSTAAEVRSSEKATETPKQSTDAKVQASHDQVLTRSQRKMEVAVPLSGSQSNASKKAAKSTTSQNASPKAAKKVDEPTITRSGASKRRRETVLPRSAAKVTTKKSQELLESPPKRTRTK
ncbi:nascent polypeptide-associated complex subunit alpha, muscle-specific form-like isoform X2 [Cololabis saira]|uniref:nascent polypeptide-associated complex subunit alpha, muscle-specific form-like isoform X2 n=1 Tax=Cololabis saira TaxID=129043 RepID=UPI002AD58E83|nr:nascent polypeptide-associated complex subunit alpha, muscle-specific form-like isoform X2 [Cololabis saira]